MMSLNKVMMVPFQIVAMFLSVAAVQPAAWSNDQPAVSVASLKIARNAQDVSLTLKDALGSGIDMNLFLAVDDGKTVAAFGHARRFNAMPHQVDASGVQFRDNQLSGSVTITIASDGCVPVKGASVVIDVSVNARLQDGRVHGSFELKPRTEATTVVSIASGKLDGSLTPMPDSQEVCRLVLNCRGVVRDSDQADKAQGIGVALAFSGGHSFAARMIPFGSITNVEVTATSERHNVRFDGRRVYGGVTAMVRNREGTNDFTLYDLELEGRVIGEFVSGSVKVKRDGKPTGTEQFEGHVIRDLPDPQDALYKLTLHRAIPRHHHMNVLFTVRDGKIIGGFAVTPDFNDAIYTVNFSGVRLDGNKLSGNLLAAADPISPKWCSYEIVGRLQDGEVTGRFVGNYGAESVSGPIEGCIDPKPNMDNISQLTLHVRDGLLGRGILTFVFDNGKLTSSSFENIHDRSVKGVVDAADIDWARELIQGKISLRMRRGETGGKAYTCRLDGVLVGMQGAGTLYVDSANWSGPSMVWVILSSGNK